MPGAAPFASVTAALAWRAVRRPERTAYIFLADGEEEQDRLTYAELDARARGIAAALCRSVAPGERALLLYPPGLDFVAAFFGCLYAGVIAVPAYPPRSRRMLPRLLAILADARPAVALAAGGARERVRGWLERTPESAALPWLATDVVDAAPAGWEPAAPTGDAVAFLQYTSGSTSTPKGVKVTQANLAHNQQVIQDACGHGEDSVFVSWLPVYHDLGLIGNLLQATWVGAPCVLMAPVAFLQNPARWPRAVSRYRGTTSGGPNFAYDLCARRGPPAEIESLDLSSWQVAFNGAEQVREETLDRFAETFAPAGFRRGALYPCYGLAEATLMVSGGRPGEEPAVREWDGRRRVSCGRALAELEVEIVDPGSGIPCPPGTVGEIWVAGDSVAHGYWNRPEETGETFGAALPDGRGPWLRTGDLGLLDGGELFVAGRLKDLIILRGTNHHPQDLEQTAEESHPAFHAGGCAAFAVDATEGERLVVVQEVERQAAAGAQDLEEMAAALRAAVAQEHEVAVHEVVLVKSGAVPKTTSGKVQRRLCRELLLAGELAVLGSSGLAELEAAAERGTPVGAAEEFLRHTFAQLARIEPSRVDPKRPLTALGLDSLTAIELQHAAETTLGASPSLSALLSGISLREAARQLESDSPVPTPKAIPVVQAAGGQPLSWGQRSLWFLNRLAPESAAYNLALAARLPNGVEAATLARSLQALVNRHPALRTLYSVGSAGADDPLQHVALHTEVAFQCADARGWSEEEARSRLHQEAFRPFDLDRGPILRAALLERGEESLLVLAVHHIAADFGSAAILVRELGQLQAAGGDAEAAGLPSPGARYTDFVRRQAEILAGPRGEELESWWRERLAGAPPLDLPADRPQPAVSSGRGVTRAAQLPGGSLAEFRAFAGEHGATPFMALMAGLQALLSRLGGQEDFLVGTPTSGREAGWAGVVGYFTNPVALRADLAGDPTGEEILARVRGAALAAYDRADYPVALLPEQPRAMLTLHQAAAPELAPLAAFALGEPGAWLATGGLTLESLALDNPAAQRPLTLTAAEIGGALALSLQLDADLFDTATADRMLGHLIQLLGSLTADPRCRLSALEILTAPERRQVLGEWSGAGLELAADTPLHRLFEVQATRAPEAVALAGEDRSLTYGELDRRANRLARRLQRHGVGPEARVGLAAGRSFGLIEGMLAILKAGGAYVPLDPRAPAERLQSLAADAGVRVVLAGREGAALFPPSTAIVGLVEIDEAGDESAAPCDGGALAANAAYVLYTSGSTGRPKGVVVAHAQVARLLPATEPWFGFHEGDVWTSFHSFTFDFSVWEIWGALAWGGRLVVVPYETSRSAGAFYDLLAEERVTVLNQTPSAFRQLDAAEGGRPRPLDLALRWVIFGGEALEPVSLKPWFERRAGSAGPRLANLYGITETTVHTTFRAVSAADAVAGAASLVGRPLPDLKLYLLDRHAAPVPALVAGEIHVGGAGLARGYLDRPDQTAERFIPDPWSGRPGARLYRSGDLARFRPDGDLEYLGRIDHQVKIRGFRIEPGEIQAVLASHLGVRESVVLALDGEGGERRLAAWVVPAAAPDAALLRRYLRKRLPDYMVPADLVFLDALPLTANGKVDRRALPAPGTTGISNSGGGYAPPRDPVEEVLVEIWADLLGGERVGIHDDFFELGGHSLLAARAVARLREPFGVEIPLASWFAQPTPAALAAEIRRLRTDGAGAELAASPVEPAPRQGEIPLSFAQESLWFLDRLAPGSPAYNLPAALRLRGPLKREALAAALAEIVRRHEALRTVFAAVDGRPHQAVLPPARQPLALVETPEGEAWRLAAAEAVRPFDLARGPLFRALLLRCSPTGHLLVLSLHHTVADGGSLSLFLGELAALYTAATAGLPSPLPELPVQYADYALWQRRRLDGAALDGQLAWWREQLAGAPPVLDLPTDRPRRAARTFRGSALPVQLSADLVADLRGLARRHGATLFMALFAGFAAVLERYSGQADLTVGAPVANRPRPELERLIGFFVSSLPLRARLEGDPGAAELLARLRAVTLGAYEHRDVPFDRLAGSEPRRDPSRHPLFQVMLAFEDGPPATPDLPGLEAELVPLATGTAKLDLTLALAVAGNGLAGEIESSDDLFDAATARRLGEHFITLLRGMVEEPRRPLSQLSLMSEAERRALLRQGKNGEAPRGGEVALADLFAERAARAPDAVAVVFAEECLTFGELDRRARGLAGRLAALGVAPEVVVGLSADPSPALLVGILGILMAGGAYLPLDPALPVERRRALLADVAAPVVLVDAGRLAELAGDGSRAVLLDGEAEVSDQRPPLAALSDNLAYVLHTSGSTGRPKAVAVPHRGITNRLLAAVEAFGIGPADTLILQSSISFDVSLWESFGALLAGARLVLPPAGVRRDATALRRLVSERGVTLLDFAPALLEVFLDDPPALPSLRGLSVGGEVVPSALAARCAAVLGVPPVNMYGPTEAAVDVLWHTWRPEDEARATVPLGRPIAGCSVLVLDRDLSPTPVGIPGELWLGGPCLARGYLGRPDLTAERFLPHPAASRPGERLYRTGDLGRWLDGGEIEFLGRVDQQVKIRGVRIEPAEVEAALAAVPGVHEAAVVAVGEGSGRRLAAYVAGDVEADALQRALRQRLPDYMVPTAWVMLAALPLTPNGKLDRAALPAPRWQSAAESRRAPRTPVEEILAGIWAELLGLERVGAADHFFELGGHSLLATQVMSRLRAAFGVDLLLRDLFEAPILADLAARVEAQRGTGPGRTLPPLVPVPREGPLPLSFAQQRLWLIDQLEPGKPLYHLPMALRVAGPLDAAALALCLGEIRRRHQALRTVFAPLAGTPVQVIQPPAPFELGVVELSRLPASAREAAALTLAGEEARHPFDLGRGPLLRGMLLRLAEDDHLVVLTLHHIAGDGWSIGILARELAALYPAVAEGRPSPLPELPLQYADFSQWQRSWLHGKALEGEISFWRRQLAGLPPLLELPTDRPRPAVQSFAGASQPVRLPAGLTRQMRCLARREGATLFMVLLAGFQVLLERYSGQRDLAVGTPVAGRNRMEIEGLIGFFVNTLVLRGDLAGEPSFRELLGRARETTLVAHAHQEVPFERLVQELSPERSLGVTPLFQVMLASQDLPMDPVELGGLGLTVLDVEAGTAKFDLSLAVEERQGELAGSLRYPTELFDPTTVRRLADHLERLLAAAAAAAAAAPERRIAELEMFSPAERAQLLVEWNDTAQGALALPFHRLFALQVGRTAAAVAVRADGDSLSYGELAARVRALAGHLCALGAGPEQVVAVCLERSIDLVATLLAVLEAGAAYLPLDPRDPEERRRQILADARPLLLLTRRSLAAGSGAVRTLYVEDLAALADATAPGADGPGNALAYVLYTSGSTGRPKGVAVDHSSLSAYLAWIAGALETAGVRWLPLLSSTTFDASLKQLFVPLLSGETVRVVSEDALLRPARLLEILDEAPGAGCNTVPALWAGLLSSLERGEAAPPAHLCAVWLGGERLPEELVIRTRQLLPGVSIHNLYGPTEATANATWCRLDEAGGVVLGRPVGGAHIAVTDRDLRPVPPGAAGELCVGGTGVARGYRDRPGQTAERFVPDPFGGNFGGRLYRTGDRARRLPDGALDFLGRLDHQIKVRGFRIEPGEIEAALEEHPGVRAVAVLARADARGETQLVAYVEPQGGQALGAGELRAHLEGKLPSYMVPGAFQVLDELPRTSTAKIDRAALAALDEPAEDRAGGTMPDTPLERVLAGMIGEVLGLEGVGLHDNFFDLGGHSMRAAELVSSLRDAFGIDFPLFYVFDAPTVAGLASVLLESPEWRQTVEELAPPLLQLIESPQERRGELVGEMG